jgi:hypothetical protein
VTKHDYLIAGLRVRLDASDAPTEADFEAYLPEFQVPREGEAEVLLTAERREEVVNPKLLGSETVTARTAGGPQIEIRRADFDGVWDPSRRVAKCLYMGGALAPLNSFLRVVCSFCLLERGGLLLHASSIVSQGRAFVFAGPSGAGKTTMARLGAPRPVLSDEVTALRPTTSRPAPAFDCFPTPFWGDLVRDRAGPPGPLALIGFPVHGDGNGEPPTLHPASTGDAFSRLLECVIAFDLSGNEKASVLDAAAAIVRSVSCVHVEYSLERSPWELLDAFGPAS